MVSNVDDGRGDNTHGRLYVPPHLTNVFTLSDIWKINNDGVKYCCKYRPNSTMMNLRKSTFWMNQ